MDGIFLLYVLAVVMSVMFSGLFNGDDVKVSE